MPILLNEFMNIRLIIIGHIEIVADFLGTIDQLFGADFRIAIGITPVKKWWKDRLVNLKSYNNLLPEASELFVGDRKWTAWKLMIFFKIDSPLVKWTVIWQNLHLIALYFSCCPLHFFRLTASTAPENFAQSFDAKLKVSTAIVHQLSTNHCWVLFGDAWAAIKTCETFI